MRALVLGGGGITGIAWELGLVAGLADAGVDLRAADLIVGTSAGSIVGAQLCSGLTLDELFERQLAPPDDEPVALLGTAVKLGFATALVRSFGSLPRFARILARRSERAAAAGRLPSLASRYAAIDRRLPEAEWPDRDLRITTVDARTGRLRVFTRADHAAGVALRDAVTASCAVPTVYPPVPIGDGVYVDGGVRSVANVDVAQGCDRVVVLTPSTLSAGPIPSAKQQVQQLGVPATVLGPDRASVSAIGPNVLDPAARAASARAGRAQAAKLAEQVAAVWS